MPYRFVHTADLHLDAPLRSLAMRDPELAEIVGDATRKALISIVDICLSERVDALVIAGDLFDGDQTSMKTARFLASQMAKLHEAGIYVYKIRGNHDHLSRISKQLVFPDTVTVFGGRADTVIHRAGGLDVAFHGLSFSAAQAPESLLPRYPAPRNGAVNIGIMHTSLGGASEHDVYAPCTVRDLHAHGFSYWALGHIHVRSVEAGRSTIVMPGTPQARDIGESGPKSVTLVTVSDDGAIACEERLTSIVQFERVCVDVSGMTQWIDLVSAIRMSMEHIRSVVPSQHLVVRLNLVGQTNLAWAIVRDQDLLLAEAQQAAARIKSVWVEKIELAVGPPQQPLSGEADPVLELAAALQKEIKTAPVQLMARDFALKLLSELPPEVRNFAGRNDTEMDTFVASMLTEAADLVTARLKAEPSK